MKKKTTWIFSLFLSFILMGANVTELSASTSESIEISDKLSESVLKREEFGLETPQARTSSPTDSYRLSQKYGFYMTQEEEKELDERLDLQTEIMPEIVSYIEQDLVLQEEFQGIYLDQSKGGVAVIALKEETPKINALGNVSDNTISESMVSIENLYSEIPIEFVNVKYSQKEIESLAELIANNHEDISSIVNLEYVQDDFINQKIQIGIVGGIDDEAKLKEYLTELTGYSSSLFLIETLDQPVNSDTSRTTNHKPLQGGLTIDSNPNTDGHCSLGFAALGSNGKHYFVTAAHCWNPGVTIYQGNQNIGSTSTLHHRGNEADAVAIALNSTSWVSSDVYSEVYGLNNIQTAGNDILGEMVWMSGRNRGQSNSSGILMAKQHSGYYAGIYFNNLRAASYTSTEGDSGGTVYADGVLKGVNKGNTTANGRNLGTYSHVTHVMARLNITPITW
ncbi:S1 family peptidase [Saccharibacillus sacchari]|uniref:S1 family peptidase n=1 Tax=Saccharibacillus sacchari TaxID=456493 RepID=UPI0004B2D5B8|nr:S1 family peptidase [Saccharibacillus sacchari]